VFLTQEGDVKIGDMGLAKQLENISYASSVLGSASFIAPELRAKKPSYNAKVDVFGMGCVALELCLLQRFDFAYKIAMNGQELFSELQDEKNYSPKLVDFIRQSLSLDPEKRPSAADLLQNFFNITMGPTYRFGPAMASSSSSASLLTSANTNINNVPSEHSPSVASNNSASSSSAFEFNTMTTTSNNNNNNNNNSNNSNNNANSLLRHAHSKDMQLLIFGMLTDRELVHCSMVCKSWFHLIQKSAPLWKLHFKQKFQLFNSDAASASVNTTAATTADTKYERKLVQEHGSVMNAYSFMMKTELNWFQNSESNNTVRYASFTIAEHKEIRALHNVKCFQDDSLAKVYLERYMNNSNKKQQQAQQQQQQQQQPASKKPTKTSPATANSPTSDNSNNNGLYAALTPLSIPASMADLENGESLIALSTTTTGTINMHLLTGLGNAKKQQYGNSSSIIKHTHVHTFDDEAHKKHHALWAIDYDRKKNDKIFVTAGHDRNIVMWDITSGEPLHTFFTAHSAEIWDIAMYNANWFASVGGDKCVKFFDMISKKNVLSINNAHQGVMYSVQFDQDQLFPHCVASGGAEGHAKIWDIRKRMSGASSSTTAAADSVATGTVVGSAATPVDNSNECCLFMYPYGKATGRGVYDIRWLGNTFVVGSGEGELTVFDIRNISKPVVEFVDKDTTPAATYAYGINSLTNDGSQVGNTFSLKYDLNLRKNGAVRGLYCDHRKIVSGSASGYVTVSDMSNGNYITRFNNIANDGDGKNYMMSLSVWENRFMCAVTATRKLCVIDLTPNNNATMMQQQQQQEQQQQQQQQQKSKVQQQQPNTKEQCSVM